MNPAMPDVAWSYTETSRETGRNVIKFFPVPRLLDPEDPRDCNKDGDCTVCWQGQGLPQDISFTGNPTLDMEPLDAEAEAISEEVRRNCKHPIDTLPGDFTQSILNDFQRQIDALAKGGHAQQPGNKAVTFQEFNDLKAMVEKLSKENSALRAVNPPKGGTPVDRPIKP